MNRQTTKTVDEIGEIHIEGNIIPPQWFKSVRLGKNADPIAVIILGEVFYWYRPTYVRDEATGEVKEIRRKFDADKWQCSYQSLANRFGFSKRQCQDAAKRLRDAGLVTLELRNFTAPNGTFLSNVLFIEPVPAAVKKITFEIPSDATTEGVLRSDVGGGTPERTTYTETPTEIPTNSEGDFENQKSLPAEEQPAEESYQQAEPHHVVKDTPQAQCGHSLTSIVSVDEGTAYCRDCVAGNNAEFESLPSASRGESPRMQSAGVATPIDDWREFKRTYLDRVAGVLGHNSPSSGDKSALKRIWQMGAPDKWETFLGHIEDGGGAEFQKAGANAYWIAGKFDDYRVSGTMQVDRASQNTADALAAMRER